MSLAIIRQWIDRAGPASLADEVNAAREIAQCLLLQAVEDAGFQSGLLFHGGTCLRLFHGLDRFSEDLDYLCKPGAKFIPEKLFDSIRKISTPYGFRFRRAVREKAVNSMTLEDRNLFASMKSPYRSMLSEKSVRGRVRIKIEINSDPPLGSVGEMKSRIGVVAYSALCCDIPTLLSGKIHALLSRTKGRDWYDLLWHAGQRTGLNREFLECACEKNRIDISRGVRAALFDRVDRINPSAMAGDIAPLLRNPASVAAWDRQAFRDAIDALELAD